MLVTKNGMVHRCDTEERYLSFKASGWEDYVPEKKPEKEPRQPKPKTRK